MESISSPEPNLGALREMALRHAAHEVEERMDARRAAPPHGVETILICLTGRPTAAMLIRRGKRVADYLGAECLAVHVRRPGCDGRCPEAEAVGKHLTFARNLRIQAEVVEGEDVAAAVVEFARRHGVSQIFMGRSRSARRPVFRRTTMHRVVALARDIEITIVAEQRR